jgi:uncharacterized membrane protein
MKPGYRILIPIGFTYLLLVLRIMITGELTYIFLAWNLFLAWIPFVISNKFKEAQNWSRWKIFFVIMAWILFLPNAPYIITDFLHLKYRAPVPYWFDILLLFSAAFNGLLLGLISLQKTEQFLSEKYGSRKAAILVFAAFFLCAFGIYIGRFLRWNSWDIIINPVELAEDISARLLNPFDNIKTWSVTILFGTFMYVIYFSVKNFLNNTSKQI